MVDMMSATAERTPRRKLLFISSHAFGIRELVIPLLVRFLEDMPSVVTS